MDSSQTIARLLAIRGSRQKEDESLVNWTDDDEDSLNPEDI